MAPHTNMRKWITAAVILGIMIWVPACKKNPTDAVAEAVVRSADATVTDVSVGPGNQIVVKGNGVLDGYVFPLGENEIAIDISGAVLAKGISTYVSGSGVIDSVELKNLDQLDNPVVRIVTDLNENVTFNLESNQEGLVLTLMEREEKSSEDEDYKIPYEETKAELERLLSGAPPSPFSGTSSGISVSAPYIRPAAQEGGVESHGPFVVQLPPSNYDGTATVVGDIFYRTLEKGIQIMVLTNGDVGDFLDFDLKDQRSIVLDFWGLREVTPKNQYSVKYGGIDKIRIGKHHDKTRVVIDLKTKIPAYDIRKTNSGVVITIIKGPYIYGGISYSVYNAGKNESLRTVAKRHYGNPNNWKRVFSANQDRFTKKEIKSIMKSDGAVEIGEGLTLRIPTR